MCGKKILIIDNDTNTQNAYEALLKPEGYNIFLTKPDKNIFDIITKTGCNLVIIDIATWGNDGDIQLAQKIKEKRYDISVFIIRTDSSPKAIKNIFKIGIEDCFIKPFLPICLLNSINRTFQRIRLCNENSCIKQDLVATQKQCEVPEMKTNKINESKNIFTKLFEYEVKRAKRNEHWLSLLLCTYQNKKELNETNFSVNLSEIIRKTIREADITTPYDNGFAIILPETSDDGCNQLCQRLKKIIDPKHDIKIGSSSYPIDSQSTKRLIKLAGSRLQ